MSRGQHCFLSASRHPRHPVPLRSSSLLWAPCLRASSPCCRRPLPSRLPGVSQPAPSLPVKPNPTSAQQHLAEPQRAPAPEKSPGPPCPWAATRLPVLTCPVSQIPALPGVTYNHLPALPWPPTRCHQGPTVVDGHRGGDAPLASDFYQLTIGEAISAPVALRQSLSGCPHHMQGLNKHRTVPRGDNVGNCTRQDVWEGTIEAHTGRGQHGQGALTRICWTETGKRFRAAGPGSPWTAGLHGGCMEPTPLGEAMKGGGDGDCPRHSGQPRAGRG